MQLCQTFQSAVGWVVQKNINYIETILCGDFVLEYLCCVIAYGTKVPEMTDVLQDL